MNKSDAEKIAGILGALGYKETALEKEADLIVVVACSVRQSAIDRIYGRSRNWQASRKRGRLKTVLTGCVLESDKKKLADKFDFILPIKNIVQLPKLLSNRPPLQTRDYFLIPPTRQFAFSAFVPIMTGCNNFCSYCVVPYTRGQEVSRPAADIIKECRRLIAAGYKEIILLGQNVNSYSAGHYDFPALLARIDSLPGDYWLRFVTSHPKDLSDKLIKTMAAGRHITPYLHLAVQSGNDKILKAMNRRYTVKHYLKLVERARQAIPEIMISTDIIVGFPSETKSQFNDTAKLMKQVGFDMAYIARYSPRPRTAASKFKDDVSREEKKRRERELTEILKGTALKRNKKLIGRTARVLVEGCKNNKCFGKNDQFKTVSFLGTPKLVGEFVTVEIKRAGSWGLFGIISKK